jgi:hypothetical protein
MQVYAKIWFYRIHIIPAKLRKEKKIERLKKAKTKAVRLTKDAIKKEPDGETKESPGIPELFDLVKNIGTVLLKNFKKHLKVRIYKLYVILASDEAQKTAVLYGSAIQSAYYLYEFLDYNFRIYKKPGDIKIIPDFAKIKTEFKIDIKFHIKLIHVIGLAASVYRTIKNKNILNI